MTVEELMERLAEFAPNTEVRLMTKQGTSSLESKLHGACDSAELADNEPGDDEVIVYLVQGDPVRPGHIDAWYLSC